MKKLFLFGALLLSGLTVQAQTAEEIVENYIETVGGKEAWDSIQGLQMNAEVQAQGMSLPVEVVNLRDGKMYVKFELQGKEITQIAFDGETLWSTNFMTMKPEKSDSEETENFKRAAGDFPGPLFHYKEKGYTLELMNEGKPEVVEGVECYKLKLTKGKQLVDGEEVDDIEYYYMDTENYVPILVQKEILSGEQKGSISEEVFSDYQEVGGVYVAFSMTSRIKDGMGQEINFSEVIVNPEVEAEAFEYKGE